VSAKTLGKCIVSAIPIVVVVSAIVSGWWKASLSAFEAPYFMPWMVAALIVAILSATPVVADGRRWWLGAAVVIAANIAASFVAMLFYAGNPAHNVLGRDIVALTMVSGAATFASSSIARFMHRLFSEPAINAEYALLIHLAFLAFSPGFWLVVHCSSGDCL
jgi:hypothetical protein